jgi:hypothetical protein
MPLEWTALLPSSGQKAADKASDRQGDFYISFILFDVRRTGHDSNAGFYLNLDRLWGVASPTLLAVKCRSLID